MVTLYTTRFNIHKLYILFTERISFLYGSQNQQKLFPHTALTDWFFILQKECVYCTVQTKSLNIAQFLNL
jgi:hypothetical protein